MHIVHQASEVMTKGRPVSLAIGFFDGVHLGHQEVIRRAIADARNLGGLSLVLTFDAHPSSIVAPTRVPPLIYHREQRVGAIAGLAPDTILVLNFDQALSRVPGEQFVQNLLRDIPTIQKISVGTNFFFGHRRTGSTELLKKIGGERGFSVEGVAPVSLVKPGETSPTTNPPISSTRIREAIASGDFTLANQMLGRPYRLTGKVVVGDRLGQKLGFPTANLDAAGLVLPPNGVYAIRAHLAEKDFPAVLNIGIRPTLGEENPTVRVEAHLLDFTGDLYGKSLGLRIVEKLRPEQKFASLDELKTQIARDVSAARKILIPEGTPMHHK